MIRYDDATTKRRETMRFGGIDTHLGELEGVVGERLGSLDAERFGERLWSKDATLWKEDPAEHASIRGTMGWLEAPARIQEAVGELVRFCAEVREAGFRHVVHMGMGGSSLAPLVFEKTFGPAPSGLPLTVLDSTDPAAILGVERQVSVPETLFIEASKSGTTAESRAFGEYFYERVKALKGAETGANCCVITDPGSMLEALAKERGYRKIFLNYPDVGGRYSALTYFGLVPAALLGLDVAAMIARALDMAKRCGPGVALRDNPGLALGVVMGELALRGRDKLTFLMPDGIASFGMWIEQLVAESTGKEDRGIVPVPCELLGAPGVYGPDRLFVEFRIESEPDAAIETAAAALKSAGHPVVTISMKDRLDLAGQFFLWEIATAAAGAVLRVNPFNQPNVEEAKQLTRQILDRVRSEGSIAEGKLEISEGPLRMYLAGGAASVSQAFSLFFDGIVPNDYVALLAYLPESDAATSALRSICGLVRERFGAAAVLEYGPRYLHSTGQLYKGGPNSGVFLLITADHPEDAPIPGQPYTFGTLMRSQALADFEALRKQRRRALRVHLAGGAGGLAALVEAAAKALGRKTES
jgi:glucose-6-phosphate isomerase